MGILIYFRAEESKKNLTAGRILTDVVHINGEDPARGLLHLYNALAWKPEAYELVSERRERFYLSLPSEGREERAGPLTDVV
jgi:hypothetical protein